LGDLTHLTIKLRGGGLVELGEVNQATRANSIQQTKSANTIGLGGVLRHLEGHSDVRHGSKIVHLVGFDFAHDVEKIGGVTKITIVKEKLQSSLMSISVKVVDTRSVEGRGPSDDTVNFVTLGKKKLSQVRTILTGDTSDQCSLCL